MEKYFNSPSYVKRFEIIDCQLVKIKEEKEYIKQKLFSLLSREKEIIKKQNAFSKLIENYNVLRDAYQHVNEELNNCEIDNDSMNIKIEEIREKCLQLEYKIKNSKEEYERLKEKSKNFELMISKKQYVLNNIKYYNYYQNLRLLKTNAELNNYKNVMICTNEKFVEQKKELFQCLNNSEDKNVQKMYIDLNNYNIMKIKMFTENQQLIAKCALMKFSNLEIEESLKKYKLQSQILLVEIDKSSDKLKLLISILNNIEIKPEEYIDKYYDKCPKLVELKHRHIAMGKNVETSASKMIKIKDYNCKLVKIIDYLNLKIDIITNETNEKQKLLIKTMDEISVKNVNLEATLNLKKQAIKKLNTELSNIKRLNEGKMENVYKSKKELYDLKSNRNIRIFMSDEFSNSNTGCSTNVNAVLNKFFS